MPVSIVPSSGAGQPKTCAPSRMTTKSAACALLALIVPALGVFPARQAPGIYPAGGQATLTIDGAGVKTGQVVFPDELPNTFNAQSSGEGDGSSTEISFSRSIVRSGAGTEYYWVDIKTYPDGPGTFVIPPLNGPTPARSANIDVQYNITDGRGVMTTSLHLASDTVHGANGTVTLSQYPSVGGRIVGTFDASLRDAQHGFGKVSGTFSIKRQP